MKRLFISLILASICSTNTTVVAEEAVIHISWGELVDEPLSQTVSAPTEKSAHQNLDTSSKSTTVSKYLSENAKKNWNGKSAYSLSNKQITGLIKALEKAKSNREHFDNLIGQADPKVCGNLSKLYELSDEEIDLMIQELKSLPKRKLFGVGLKTLATTLLGAAPLTMVGLLKGYFAIFNNEFFLEYAGAEKMSAEKQEYKIISNSQFAQDNQFEVHEAPMPLGFVALAHGSKHIIVEPLFYLLTQHIEARLISEGLSKEAAQEEVLKVKKFILTHETKHLAHKDLVYSCFITLVLFPGAKALLRGYEYAANKLFAWYAKRNKLSKTHPLYKVKKWNSTVAQSNLLAFLLSVMGYCKSHQWFEARADRTAIEELGKDGAQGCIHFCDQIMEMSTPTQRAIDVIHPSIESRKAWAENYLKNC